MTLISGDLKRELVRVVVLPYLSNRYNSSRAVEQVCNVLLYVRVVKRTSENTLQKPDLEDQLEYWEASIQKICNRWQRSGPECDWVYWQLSYQPDL